VRADMISSRRLRPAGVSGQQISFVVDEARPLVNLMGPVTTRGTFHGVTPGCHAALPAPPPQPALVICDGLSKSHPAVKLAKAIQAHAEAMSKAETMFEGGQPPVDVSTPQHEHARLTAKKTYLEGKLDAHQRSMHPADHPDVAHRTKVLGQVNQKLSSMESQGIKSGPEHHEDWLHHYSTRSDLHPDDVNTALHSHMGVLASPKAKTMRRETEGTQRGAATPEIHPAVPGVDAHELKSRPKLQDMLSQLRSEPNLGAVKGLFLRSNLFGKSTPPARLGLPHKQEDFDRVSDKANKIGTSFGFDMEAHRQNCRFPYHLGSHRYEKLDHAEMALDSSAEKQRGAKARMKQGVSKAKGKEWISEKIRLLMHEGKPQDQAIAIAHSMAGRGKSLGLYVTQ